MALREERSDTAGTRIFDVLRFANVQKAELAEAIGRPASYVSRLPRHPERITVHVIQAASELCAGKGILAHCDWREIRAFILDGEDLPGPEFLTPSQAPSGGGGRVIPLKGDGSDDILYCRLRAS